MTHILTKCFLTVFAFCVLWKGLSSPKFLWYSSSSSENNFKTNVSSTRQIDMSAFRAVFVTVPTAEVGKQIAQGLISQKLAACVNIIPQITSMYEWEGKINEDTELLLMIKTQANLFEDLEKFVRENHPYTVPEIIAVPIEQGSQPYLNWIKEITDKKLK